MARLFHLSSSQAVRKWWHLLLAWCWICGWFLGQFLFLRTDPAVRSLMHGAAACPVSIVGLITGLVFPFLLSASAVLLSEPWLLPILALVRAAICAYLYPGMLPSYGFLQWLLLFSQLAVLPLYYWVSLHYLTGEKPLSCAGFFFLLALLFLIGSIDYCMITPHRVNLIDFMKG